MRRASRPLAAAEIDDAYEWNTGVASAEHFEVGRFGAGPLDPSYVPGVLLPFHTPFAWGATPAQAVEHAVVVEEIAGLAWCTKVLNPKATLALAEIAAKHFFRKHGYGAYYRQPKEQK